MNRTFWMWLLVAIALPGSLVVMGLNVLVSPVGFGLGIPFAAVYLTLGILLFRLGPLWPRVGVLYVLSCLSWGAGMSMALVSLPSAAWMEITDKLGWDALLAAFAGAYPEEIVKSLGVLVILYSFRKLNRPWHGFVTGGLVGLGFEVNENLGYGAVGAMLDPNSDLDGALFMWGARTLAGPGLHVTLSALAGWGIGQALFERGKLKALWWIGVAFSVHFLWNIILPTMMASYIQYGILMLILYPTFVFVYRKAVKLQREDNSYVLLM